MIGKMFPPGQEALHRQLGDRILQSLLRLDVERDQDFINDYVHTILPALCSDDSVDKLAKLIGNRAELGLIATKGLRETHQEDQRCMAMAALQRGEVSLY